MKTISAGAKLTVAPKRRQRHYSYDESLDESAKLIADEPAEVERETPAEENEAIERSEEGESAGPSAFEE